MFGAEEQARSVRSQPWTKPLVIAVLGATLTGVAVFLALVGLYWPAPLLVGPSLVVMGVVGLVFPGFTAVFGFDWRPYPAWQVWLGVAWFGATIVVPMFVLSLLFVVSMLLAAV